MIVQCDFDGTIIKNNLSVLLRQRYAGGDWHKIESDYFNGYLTVEQSNKLQFALIKEPKEKLQEFACQHIEIRQGFVEFVTYCLENSIEFVIVSFFSDNGIIVSYTDPGGRIINEGFKRKYLASLKKRGENVIYVGDGLSDLEAARGADYIFATAQLLKLLSTESIPCHNFSDFYDILHQVRQLQ